MNPKEWQLIQQLFHEMSELSQDEWKKYIEKKSHLAPKIKNKVLDLLANEKNSSSNVDNVKQQVSSLFNEVNLPIIENYEVLERIAIGGMGSVYKAWDDRLSRYVAIKLLHPHRSQQTKAKQRFLREARSSAKLRHKNICPIFEISQTTDEILYIVSAYCDGVDLSHKIRANSFNLKQIFSIFDQLLSALEVAHNQGIVHRDLKPENIIIDDNNIIQLVDFGIARNYDDYQTITGEILGTPDYMSPEQYRGEAFDHLSDIWSCGIILYEMLEGHSPYYGKTAPEIVYSMLHETIPIPEGHADSLSGLYSIIRLCLQTDKSLRPANINSLQTMLAKARSKVNNHDDLATKPSHKKASQNIERKSLNTFSTQRQIVSLHLKIDSNIIDKDLNKSLESTCSKYKGIISKKKLSIKNKTFLMSAFFGYPIADELKIKNTITCGHEWEEILSTTNLNYSLLAGLETLIEQEKSFATDPTLQNQDWLTGNLVKNISNYGFWVTNKLAKGMRDNLAIFQETKTFLNENTEITCHLIKNNHSNEFKLNQINSSQFIGRNSQLSLLLESWEQALEGDQQRVLLSGEAGIGKSRLIYEFRERIQSSPQINIIELDCSPYEKASTYYPILQNIRYQISLNQKIDPQQDTIIDRKTLLSYLESRLKTDNTDEYLFYKLMGIELTLEEYSDLPTGDLLNRQYQFLLLRLLITKPENVTTLIIIEDLHWADTATGILVEKLLQPSVSHQTMILMSSRPEYKPAWLSNIVTSNLYLSKLRQKHSEYLLKYLLDKVEDIDQKLSLKGDMTSLSTNSLISQLVDKTDGNPLFIEEMVKTVLINLSSSKSTTELLIPDTIQDTLIVRLERLGVSQYLAQVASVIGRSFKLELLRECYSESQAEFNQQLHTLVQADIIQCIDGKQQYRFKHALIRDAAYQMITPRSRKSLHQNLAKTLETRFPKVLENQPELLAQHWEAAGVVENAIEYWLLVAERNQQFSATSECIEVCDHIVDIAEQNLDLQLAGAFKLKAYTRKGPALMAKYGYADERINEVYSEALELCEKYNETESKIPLLYGLWTYYCVKAEHKKALKHAKEMLKLSEQMNSIEKCISNSVSGMTLFYLGQFEEAKPHFSLALNFYDEADIQKHIILYGHDFKVVTQSFQSWNECFLGDIEQAIQISKESVDYARKRNHQLSLTYAISFAAWLKLNLGQIEDAEILVKESIDICKEYDIAIFLGLSMSFHALILFSKGEVKQGHEIMGEAEKIFFGTGANVFRASFFAAKAEVAFLLQDIESAEALLEQSLQVIENTTEEFGIVPTLALKALVHSHKQETKQAAEYMNLTYKKIKSQNSLGLQAMLEQKGISFDGLE